MPPFTRPDVAEFGWAIVIGLAAAFLGPACQWLGRFLYPYAKKRAMIVVPLAGVAVGAVTIIYTEATGKPSSDVLFSGQDQMGPLIHDAASYSVGALLLLLVCKSVAYGVSLSSFRGGPIFPALFIGVAGGIARMRQVTPIPPGSCPACGGMMPSGERRDMGQTVRFQEILRRLALTGPGHAGHRGAGHPSSRPRSRARATAWLRVEAPSLR